MLRQSETSPNTDELQGPPTAPKTDGFAVKLVAQPDVAPVRDFAEHRRIAVSTDCADRRACQLYAEIVPNTMPAIMTAAQKSL